MNELTTYDLNVTIDALLMYEQENKPIEENERLMQRLREINEFMKGDGNMKRYNSNYLKMIVNVLERIDE